MKVTLIHILAAREQIIQFLNIWKGPSWAKDKKINELKYGSVPFLILLVAGGGGTYPGEAATTYVGITIWIPVAATGALAAWML